MARMNGGGGVSKAVAITDTYVVTNPADLTGLTAARVGDVGIVTSTNETYILQADPYSTLGNWVELLSNSVIAGGAVAGNIAYFNNSYTIVGSNDFRYAAIPQTFIMGPGNTGPAASGFALVGGWNNASTGVRSIVWGEGLVISGTSAYDAVFGYSGTLTGGGNLALLYSSAVTGDYNLVGGSTHTIIGSYNTVGGYVQAVNSSNNAVFGQTHTVNGSQGHNIITGLTNYIDGARNALFGESTPISGNYNIAAGYDHVGITGDCNAAFGSTNTVTGGYNTVGGQGNAITSSHDAVFGLNNVVKAPYSVVGGRSNTVDTGGTDYIVLGNGNYSIGGNNSVLIGYGNVNLYGGGVFAFGQSNGVADILSMALGFSNAINGQYNIGFGYSNITGGNVYNTHNVAVGQSNELYSHYNMAFGYNIKNADGDTNQHSTGIGFYAHLRQYGEIAHAAGRFTINGDAQTSVLVARKQTTNDTVTELALDGGTTYLSTEDNKAYAFKVTITAKQASSLNHAMYTFEWSTVRGTGVGTVTVDGLVKTVIFESVAAWDVNVTADLTNGRPAISVTGVAATTIRWVAKIEITEVA